MPVRSERPYIVQQLTPVQHNMRWWLKDQQEQIMPLKSGFRNIWKLLSLSGGLPLDMALHYWERNRSTSHWAYGTTGRIN